MDPQFFNVLRNRKVICRSYSFASLRGGRGLIWEAFVIHFHSTERFSAIGILAASPNVETAAPSNTTSFRRNCPGNADSAGNPPRLGFQPGVENRKLTAVRNISTAEALPIDDSLGEKGRRAMRLATAIPTMPSKLENVWTLSNLYIQPMTGL